MKQPTVEVFTQYPIKMTMTAGAVNAAMYAAYWGGRCAAAILLGTSSLLDDRYASLAAETIAVSAAKTAWNFAKQAIEKGVES